jgi:hypothetical protein
MTPKHGKFGRGFALLAAIALVAQIAGPVAVAQPAPTDENRLQSPDTDIAKKRGDLSDKLDSSNGVIRPEGSIDPGMQKPTPPAGPMPLIPPPGGQGGDPRAQPK